MRDGDLIERLRAIHSRIDALRPRRLEVAEIADARLTIDPGVDCEFASICPNRAMFLGSRGAVGDRAVGEIIDRFGAGGVKHFFLWITPTEHTVGLHERLLARGFREISWVQYFTLARSAAIDVGKGGGHSADATAARTTALTVRRVGEADRALLERTLPAVYGDEHSSGFFMRSLGDAMVDHFIVLDGDRPVAASALVVDGPVAWLGFAHTAAAERKRGAQTAMIAARVARAGERGCEVCVAETLSMLGSSLANLRRAGFETAHVKRVYEWGGPA